MAGHASLNDLFDSIEAISWIIAGIRRCPVFPGLDVAPPKSKLHGMASEWAAKLNIERNSDVQKMLKEADISSDLLETDDHIVKQAYGEVLDILSAMRSRMTYREMRFTRTEGKNTVNGYGLYLNPLFKSIFDEARNFVIRGVDDPNDAFVKYLNEIYPDGKSDINEYDDFVDRIARNQSNKSIGEIVESIGEYVDIRGNLLPM
jgi:hypothetical protein